MGAWEHGRVPDKPLPVSSIVRLDWELATKASLMPGADAFLGALAAGGHPFLVLTNNSIYSARDLSARLGNLGLDVPAGSLWTSAEATAAFLDSQRPNGTAFVVGEAGLTSALHEAGYVLTAPAPRLRRPGGDPDVQLRSHHPGHPAGGRRGPVHRHQSGRDRTLARRHPSGHGVGGRLDRAGDRGRPYFIGKPNPLMMREALNSLGAHSETTVMIGDRMDTDIVAGIEAGLSTILVLSGVTGRVRRRPVPVPTRENRGTRSPTSSTRSAAADRHRLPDPVGRLRPPSKVTARAASAHLRRPTPMGGDGRRRPP